MILLYYWWKILATVHTTVLPLWSSKKAKERRKDNGRRSVDEVVVIVCSIVFTCLKIARHKGVMESRLVQVSEVHVFLVSQIAERRAIELQLSHMIPITTGSHALLTVATPILPC